MPTPQPPRDSSRGRIASRHTPRTSPLAPVVASPTATSAVSLTAAPGAQVHTTTGNRGANLDDDRARQTGAVHASPYVHPTYDTMRMVPAAHNELLPAAPARMESSRWVVDPEIAAAWQTPDLHERTYHEGAWKPDTSTLAPGDTMPAPPSRWSLRIIRASRAASGELEAAIGAHFHARISRLTLGVAIAIGVMLFAIVLIVCVA